MSAIKGIRQTPRGWRVYGRVDGQFFSRSFKPETSLKTMKDWRHDERTRIRARHLGAGDDRPASGTLAADVADYLVIVKAMPTLAQRTYDLKCWITALGGERPRRSVKAPEIASVLSGWKATGLAAGTVNRRRTALMHLWHRLDGKSAPNPLRDVPRFHEPGARPRGRPYPMLERVFRAMVPSKSRARLKAIAYIGLAHVELKQVQPHEDWNRRAGTLVVRGRAKGDGTQSRVVKLTARGTTALHEMARTDAWGWFSNSTLNRRWTAALARVRTEDDTPDLPHVRPYDLRHSMGTEIYRLTRDVKAVKEYLGHASIQTSERYMHAAVSQGVSKAAAAFNKAHPARRRPRRAPVRNFPATFRGRRRGLPGAAAPRDRQNS
jgi:integrase